ncbi:LysR family transcriptional regulator [Burkholderia sp. Ac-20379]|uniref:LysR family transcriptional regulator n=1 Tax=Burkholderia sp. Ac-20379 TaxID=2703900 RepID=UPI00197D371D|nr:LysR family transcriptional regulator [Burkholderia sp. Ac-20379]MBN3727326.1 LysR family transcriptional regulator [Burkholderia sp. Ac-20379]
MDRIEAMTMLIAAVDTGSFSAAARALHIPAPTLTRKINDLEQRIGAQLLTRTTRGLKPTDAGADYVARARGILALVDAQERDASGEFTAPRGELAVSAPVLFGHLHVLPHLADFLARFPAINIALDQSDRHVNLAEAGVDLAVRIGRLPSSGLIATRVGAMRAVVCASPELIARHGAPGVPQDLAGMPCVVVNAPTLAPAWQFRSRQDAAGDGVEAVAIKPRLRVGTAASGVDAAAAGIGYVRVLHYQARHAIEAGRLRIVLGAFETEPVPVQLVHAAHGPMPVKLRRLLDFLAPRLRAELAPFGAARAT